MPQGNDYIPDSVPTQRAFSDGAWALVAELGLDEMSEERQGLLVAGAVWACAGCAVPPDRDSGHMVNSAARAAALSAMRSNAAVPRRDARNGQWVAM